MGRVGFAYRRKVYKELSYDERGKPAKRKKSSQHVELQGGIERLALAFLNRSMAAYRGAEIAGVCRADY